jgi:hypothetical protein
MTDLPKYSNGISDIFNPDPGLIFTPEILSHVTLKQDFFFSFFFATSQP